MIINENKQRVASWFSASPIAFGLTVTDVYWIIEGFAGAALVYAALTETGSAHQWFGGNAAFVGSMMIVATCFRVGDFMVDEITIAMNVLLLFAASSIFGITATDVKNELMAASPTFNYHAQTPQQPSRLPPVQQASLSPTAKTSCVWHNTSQNRALKGDEAQWCKNAVENKLKGYEFCKCQ